MNPRLVLSLAAALPLAAANLGCYNPLDIPFRHLHGDDSNTSNDEVKLDIAISCHNIENRVFTRTDAKWTRCSEWAVTKGPVDDTCVWCHLGIHSMCDACERSKTRRIDWEIHLRSAEDLADNTDLPAVEEQTLTYEDCVSAFETELGGCPYGSEQNHGYFWYKIDPNKGPCS